MYSLCIAKRSLIRRTISLTQLTLIAPLVMTLPRNDIQAQHRYGISLLPLISHWRDRLTSTCSSSAALEPLSRLIRSDVFETQVFKGMCQLLEAPNAPAGYPVQEWLSPHVLLVLTDILGRHGYSSETQHLVDKLVAS